jgi:hypothetical protein
MSLDTLNSRRWWFILSYYLYLHTTADPSPLSSTPRLGRIIQTISPHLVLEYVTPDFHPWLWESKLAVSRKNATSNSMELVWCVCIQFRVFWFLTPCSLVGGHTRFGVTFCPHHRGSTRKLETKYYAPFRLHGIAIHKTVMLIRFL